MSGYENLVGTFGNADVCKALQEAEANGANITQAVSLPIAKTPVVWVDEIEDYAQGNFTASAQGVFNFLQEGGKMFNQQLSISGAKCFKGQVGKITLWKVWQSGPDDAFFFAEMPS